MTVNSVLAVPDEGPAKGMDMTSVADMVIEMKEASRREGALETLRRTERMASSLKNHVAKLSGSNASSTTDQQVRGQKDALQTVIDWLALEIEELGGAGAEE